MEKSVSYVSRLNSSIKPVVKLRNVREFWEYFPWELAIRTPLEILFRDVALTTTYEKYKGMNDILR